MGSKLKWTKYHDVELYPAETDFMKELEATIGKIIPAVSQFGPEMFGYIHLKGHILALALEKQHLQTLPDRIGKLRSLNYLWLNHNELKTLPKELLQLTVFTQLHIQNNRFEEIPEWISTMVQL